MNINNIIAVFLLSSFLVKSNVNKNTFVNGRIDNYDPKKNLVVVPKIYKNWEPLNLDMVKVNKDGTFKINLNRYKGIMETHIYTFPYDKNSPPMANIPIIIDGKENVDIVIYNNRPPKILKGFENKVFVKKMVDYVELLNKLYQINSQINTYKKGDDFYNQLYKQQQILSKKIKNIKKIDVKKNPYASYYLDLQLQLQNILPKISPNASIEELKRIKKTLFDNMDVNNKKLTNSRFIAIIVNDYFNINNYIFRGDNKKVENTIKKDLDRLFSKKINLRLSEGQIAFQFMMGLFKSMGKDKIIDYMVAKIDAIEDCDMSPYLKKKIDKQKRTMVGSRVPEIVFSKKLKNGIKKLSDIKKRTIVVFWASWCGHCDKNIPKLIPIYEKLKKKNIEILAISLDDNKKEYEEAIKKFKWLNYCDYKKWRSKPADDYNISSTPSYILVNENMILEYKFDNIYEIKKYFKL